MAEEDIDVVTTDVTQFGEECLEMFDIFKKDMSGRIESLKGVATASATKVGVVFNELIRMSIEFVETAAKPYALLGADKKQVCVWIAKKTASDLLGIDDETVDAVHGLFDVADCVIDTIVAASKGLINVNKKCRVCCRRTIRR